MFRHKPISLPRPFAFCLAAALLFPIRLFPAPPSPSRQHADEKGLQPIEKYIASGWDTLTRSLSECSTVVDPKLASPSILYLPADLPMPASVEEMQKKCHVEIMRLPKVIHHPGDLDSSAITQQGLLYLDHKYVVPGGRFNEMYGWDSYFIIVGLLRDGRIELAKGMVENFFFEIEHYGTVLNANRTYYLTRSQPPFLTSMILAVYNAEKASGHDDRDWLERAYGFASRDYENWVHDPHLAGDTGLSRYYDYGTGPPPESGKDEAGIQRRVVAYFLGHPEQGRGLLVINASENSSISVVGPKYDLEVCDIAHTMARPECERAGTVSLDGDFYKGDRSMRESGYDVSFRFGPFGSRTHHFAPVCLNSLLYKTETDLEKISQILGKDKDSTAWHERAAARKELIQKYFWDPDRGMYFDYDFDRRARSTYEYLTTYFPMWAGIATPEQARALVKNLKIFERPGGLVMSPYETGAQWDYPYAWAPNQLITDVGLRNYGYNEDADRVSFEFLSDVAQNFRRDGTIREKYDAVTSSSQTNVTAGYHMNVIGFGWTNGVFLQLLHDLPQNLAEKLSDEQNEAVQPAAK
jgi:alpha,alpha-trehalase